MTHEPCVFGLRITPSRSPRAAVPPRCASASARGAPCAAPPAMHAACPWRAWGPWGGGAWRVGPTRDARRAVPPSLRGSSTVYRKKAHVRTAAGTLQRNMNAKATAHKSTPRTQLRARAHASWRGDVITWSSGATPWSLVVQLVRNHISRPLALRPAIRAHTPPRARRAHTHSGPHLVHVRPRCSAGSRHANYQAWNRALSGRSHHMEQPEAKGFTP